MKLGENNVKLRKTGGESGLFRLIPTAACDKVGAGLKPVRTATLRIGIFKKWGSGWQNNDF